MNLEEIFAFFGANGIRASVQHGELALQAPKGAIDARMATLLKASKADIIAAIESGRGPATKAEGNTALGATPRITPVMLPLVSLSQEEIDNLVATVPRGALNTQDIYPLAALQEGILFHHLLATEGDPYLLRSILTFDSRQRLDALVCALQAVIDRHDILRTSIHWEGLSRSVQVVQRHARLPVFELKLDVGDALADLLARTDPFRVKLDLHRAPLLAAYVGEDRATGEWRMVLLAHHLVCDHVTLELIMGEVELLLQGRSDELSVQKPFRQFVAQVGATPEAGHEAYFREQLGDIDEPTAPFGVLDVIGSGRALDEDTVTLPASLSQRLRASARRLGLSPAVLFHVAWAQVLGKCTGRTDVVFGTVLSGRLQGLDRADRMMGLFINTLPLRINVAGGVLEVVRDSYRRMTALLVHEQASLALAQRCSAVAAPLPLFTSLLNYRHSAVQGAATQATFEGIRVIATEERTNYPLNTNVDDLGVEFALSTKCVLGISATRINAYFETALDALAHALVESPERSMGSIKILPDFERQRLLVQFNATAADFPHDALIHEQFEAQVGANPDAIAVVHSDATLSYAQLNRHANQLARHLRAAGVGPDVPVALCLERSLEMVVAMVAINKAGGAYVPIDPEYPRDRTAYMLANSGARLLLKQRRLLVGEAFEGVELLDLDDESTRTRLAALPGEDVGRGSTGITSTRLSYIIYTSGSTGRPKGVMIEHRALVNRIHWMQKQYRLTPDDCVLQKTPYSFDVSVWEFWWTLVQGARLVMAAPGGHRDPAYLQHAIQSHGITTLHFVPSMLASMLASIRWETCTSVRQVFCSGEALDLRLVEEYWKTGTRAALHNLYGPTEAAIDVTRWDCRGHGSVESIPIGKPIDNIQLYVLDPSGCPTPLGVAGELHIGGVGLARGYINNPDLTDSRFVTISLPDVSTQTQRLYRTGDLARWTADGQVEYIGRIDNQVKLNGLRIELGEIESQLTTCEHIREAVVLAVSLGKDASEKQLVAYVVRAAHAGAAAGEPGLAGASARKAIYREYLAERLPGYMVPTIFVELDRLPTTLNGKLDRSTLPLPSEVDVQRKEYVAPRNHGEAVLCRIWQGVLGLDRIGVHDNYFELGGNSLRTVQIVSAASRDGVQITVGQIFKNPTIARLAEIAGTQSLRSPASVTAAVIDQTYGINDAGDVQIAEFAVEGQFTETHLRQVVKGLFNTFPQLGGRLQEVGVDTPLRYRPLDRNLMREILGGPSRPGEVATGADVSHDTWMARVGGEILSGQGSAFRTTLLPGHGAAKRLVLVAHPAMLGASQWDDVLAEAISLSKAIQSRVGHSEVPAMADVAGPARSAT